MLVLKVLRNALPCLIESSGLPAALVLGLSEDERKRCGQLRFQQRTIRSAQAGTLLVNYETGSAPEDRIRPAELDAVVAKGMTFSYDVIAEVLELRYVQLKQREEIQALMAAKNVSISTGSVSNLSRLGLACLEQNHQAAAASLGHHYRQEAFILHMDGTHEGGQWCHFVVREGMSGNVLLGRKIRSEHSEDIGDILRCVVELFGSPDAVVSDMSAAICKAVEEVLPGVFHQLCHFHFLKAAGIAMLGPDHDAFGHGVKRTRSELKKLRRDCVAELRRGDGCQKWVISLIDRINEYAGDLSAEGFPFDLPNLKYIQRCKEALHQIEPLLAYRSRHTTSAAAFDHLLRFRVLLRHYTESRAGTGTTRLEKRNALFLQLREILHPVREDTRAPLNWGRVEEPVHAADIAERLDTFCCKAQRMNARKSLNPADRKMWRSLHRTLEKHADKLNPLLLVRGRSYVLPRTNNLSETSFRDMKRRQRRTTGNGDLKRQLDHMPAQAFYVENLADPLYRKITFRGRPMCECFADTDWPKVRKTIKEMKCPPRVGTIDHALINSDSFFATVKEALRSIGDTPPPELAKCTILTP